VCYPLISIPVFAATGLMGCCMIRLIQYGCFASHLRAGEDVVAVLRIESLPTPSQEFFDQHIIQWDALFRSFRFDLTDAPFHY
jgi:hypothetical protein